MTLFLLHTALGAELPPCSESPDPEAQAALTEIYDAARAPEGAEGSKSRVKAVLKMSKKGQICTGDDHYRAGYVLLASKDASTLETAYAFAMVAAHAHVDRSKWLANNAVDRWQLSLGQPQRFGTQIGPKGDCLYPIDEQFPDDNRLAWGAHTLVDTYSEFLKRQGMEGRSPTTTTLHSLGLFCPLEAW